MRMMLLFLTTLGLAAGFAWGQSPGWPRVIKDSGIEITVYQPQPDSLDGLTLQSRVALSVKRPEDKAPAFGAVWLTATLELDGATDLVRVVRVKIDRSHIAGIAEEDVPALVEILESRRSW
jgi:hypothetical protein